MNEENPNIYLTSEEINWLKGICTRYKSLKDISPNIVIPNQQEMEDLSSNFLKKLNMMKDD